MGIYPKVFVVIPTYNEAENIKNLIEKILSVQPGVTVAVVDDDSPDGTWRIVSDNFGRDPQVHLIRRTADRGRGSAGIEGFKYALKNAADYIIEMDGDFSHDPKFIPDLMDCDKVIDVVLGSRYIQGGRDCRGFLRRLISWFAGWYLRFMLGVAVTDPTSGFRRFSRTILGRIDMNSLKAKDQFIVTELLYRAHKAGAKIAEVPIEFKDRTKGTSKLGHKALIKYLWKVLILRLSFTQ